MEDFGNDILTKVLRRRWMSISTEQEHGEMVYTLVKNIPIHVLWQYQISRR